MFTRARITTISGLLGLLLATVTLVATATDGSKETKAQKLKIKPAKKKK